MLIKLDQALMESLTETEKKIVAFINLNADKISVMSISDVAEQTFSSPATVSRTIKKCGMSGFAELRFQLAQQEKAQQASASVNEILKKSLKEVTYTLEQLSADDILKTVQAISSAKRIFLFARGLSEQVAQEFALKLQLLGFYAFTNYDPLTMQAISRQLQRGDLVIIFSLSGKTHELIRTAENASSLGVRIICITCGDNEVPLAKIAQINLFGYRHSHVSIKNTDAAPRLPLFVISRVIVDYLAIHCEEEKKKKLAKEKEQAKRHRYFTESDMYST